MYLARVGVISVPVLGACVDFLITAEKLAHTVLYKSSCVQIQEVLDSLGGVSCLSSCRILQGLSGEQTAVAVIHPEDQNPLGTLKNTIVSKVPNKFSNKDCIFCLIYVQLRLPPISDPQRQSHKDPALFTGIWNSRSLLDGTFTKLPSSLRHFPFKKVGRKLTKEIYFVKFGGKKSPLLQIYAVEIQWTQLIANTWYNSS